jgi:hypothetical protein
MVLLTSKSMVEVLGLSALTPYTLHGLDPLDTHPDIKKALNQLFLFRITPILTATYRAFTAFSYFQEKVN